MENHPFPIVNGWVYLTENVDQSEILPQHYQITFLMKVFHILMMNMERQPPEVFYTKGVLKNFAKFTVKSLC